MKVEYKYNVYDRVKTPLVDNGIVTMLGYQDGIVKYFVESNTEGAENCWWIESNVSKV